MGSGAHLPVTFGLEGRVAVVIGGTGALGSTMASALAAAGARTFVVGRDEERGARVAENLRADGDDVVFAHCDVRAAPSFERSSSASWTRTGGSTSSSTAPA